MGLPTNPFNADEFPFNEFSRSEAVLLSAALMASKEMKTWELWWIECGDINSVIECYWFICVYVDIRYVYAMCVNIMYTITIYIYWIDMKMMIL